MTPSLTTTAPNTPPVFSTIDPFLLSSIALAINTCLLSSITSLIEFNLFILKTQVIKKKDKKINSIPLL